MTVQFDMFAVQARKAKEADACPECGLAGGHTDDPCPGRPTVEPPRPVLDLAEGRRRRDEGMAAADRAAREEFKLTARAFMRVVASENVEVTADDLYAYGLEESEHHNALGSVFTWAVREGLIEPTDRIRQSARPSRHATAMRVWLSLVHRREVGT